MSRASDRAHATIRNLILSGDMRPGVQLREEQLAEICGVSRTPVRDALRRLEAEMYVTRSGSRRVFVVDWSRADIDEMFTLRSMLEGHAAARAATRLDTEGLSRLKLCNQRINEAALSVDINIDSFLEENRVFHSTVIVAAQSERLASLLKIIVEQPIVRQTAIGYSRDQLIQSANEHRELIQAFEARDPEWARSMMATHIRRAFHVFARQADAEQLVKHDSAEAIATSS